jgi:hypothetical protein
MFHITFPAITVGLSIFLSILYGMYWTTRRPVYLQLFRFWRRIFAVGFAIGVVAGIVITFEMGLNWGVYARAPHAGRLGMGLSPAPAGGRQSRWQFGRWYCAWPGFGRYDRAGRRQPTRVISTVTPKSSAFCPE